MCSCSSKQHCFLKQNKTKRLLYPCSFGIKNTCVICDLYTISMSSATLICNINCDKQAKLTNCTKLLWNQEQFSDVLFDFPDEKTKIYGHKLLLSIRSSVFSTMFYGAVTDVTSNCNIVKIEDVSSDSFLEMLKFIYTDEVNITDDNLGEIMYVAHKYSIKYLERLCCVYMQKELNKENCFKYLEQFYIYDNDFTEHCMKLIDSSIHDFLAEGKLNELSEKPLLMILKRDSLQVNELDLFKSLLNWAEKSCKEKELEATVQNMREMFSVFELVRFPTMSLEEISECHRIGNMFFTPEEVYNIFNYKSNNTITDSLRYSTRSRQLLYGNLRSLIFLNRVKCNYLDVQYKSNFSVNEIVKIEKIYCQMSNTSHVKILEKFKILFECNRFMMKGSLYINLNLILRPNLEYTILTEYSHGEFCMYQLFGHMNVFNFQQNSFSLINGIEYKLSL